MRLAEYICPHLTTAKRRVYEALLFSNQMLRKATKTFEDGVFVKDDISGLANCAGSCGEKYCVTIFMTGLSRDRKSLKVGVTRAFGDLENVRDLLWVAQSEESG